MVTKETVKEQELEKGIKQLILERDSARLALYLDISEANARYIITNPCLVGSVESCERYKRWLSQPFPEDQKTRLLESLEECAGCINLNGYLVMRTGPDDKPKPVGKIMEMLKEECFPLYRFVVKKYDL